MTHHALNFILLLPPSHFGWITFFQWDWRWRAPTWPRIYDVNGVSAAKTDPSFLELGWLNVKSAYKPVLVAVWNSFPSCSIYFHGVSTTLKLKFNNPPKWRHKGGGRGTYEIEDKINMRRTSYAGESSSRSSLPSGESRNQTSFLSFFYYCFLPPKKLEELRYSRVRVDRLIVSPAVGQSVYCLVDWSQLHVSLFPRPHNFRAHQLLLSRCQPLFFFLPVPPATQEQSIIWLPPNLIFVFFSLLHILYLPHLDVSLDVSCWLSFIVSHLKQKQKKPQKQKRNKRIVRYAIK